MDIWPDPGGLCIFIDICLHSWMGNKFLYYIIVCYKPHTLFSSSPASSGTSLKKQGSLSRKICHEVKITPGKRLRSGMLTDHINESNYAKCPLMKTSENRWWEQPWQHVDEQVQTAPLFTYLRWVAKLGKPNSLIEGCWVSFCCAQWTWLWLYRQITTEVIKNSIQKFKLIEIQKGEVTLLNGRCF